MKPLIIAGPCSAESEEQVLETARELQKGSRPMVFRAGLWKPRTHPGGFQGVGEKGLPWLVRVREELGLPLATEVATAEHVEAVAPYGIEYVWIGARTTSSPFAMEQIAEALRHARENHGYSPVVMVKNPVSPDIELWTGAIERLRGAGVQDIVLVHRGFSHYGASPYRNAPMWALALEMKRRHPSLPMVCDPSHIAGCRHLVADISQSALDMDYQGLMTECHIAPDEALSDASQQLTPADFLKMLDTLKFRGGAGSDAILESMRRRIDECDDELLRLLARRMQISEEIGEFKRNHDMTAVQMDRHDSIMRHRMQQAEKLGLNPEAIRRIMATIHQESVHRQIEILKRERD